MMKLKSLFLILCFFAAFSLLGTAQERAVKGKVTAFETVPLINVTVTCKGLDTEVLTDENGCFMLRCNDKEKLRISAHGFYSENVNLRNFAEGDSVFVDLRFRKGDKNFEIATGYGHISGKQLSYAIEQLEADSGYSSYRDILEAIEGRISGVSIGNNAIIIRGATTINSGATPALLVVDGTIVEFPVFVNIPPTQVKSISVIKGAAASARYGSRGMGGVIVVKTKQ
ncbi:TonB-dependent receptor plug domain-containing protein [Sunxiuqinia sp. sy24]|uniref:TonB-dependent receptor plug domain-containing protein n=1 Tax=Sunxiuqinia sp. sy24 TaxID=3461495 RepID=UPI0040453D73